MSGALWAEDPILILPTGMLYDEIGQARMANMFKGAVAVPITLPQAGDTTMLLHLLRASAPLQPCHRRRTSPLTITRPRMQKAPMTYLLLRYQIQTPFHFARPDELFPSAVRRWGRPLQSLKRDPELQQSKGRQMTTRVSIGQEP